MLAAKRPPRLSVQRLSFLEWSKRPTNASVLGALGYGVSAAPGVPLPAPVRGMLLAGAEPAVDAWSVGARRVESGTCGSVRWRADAHWLFGALEIDEGGRGDLAALAQRAYGDVFETLRHTGYPYLLRLWNSLPGINGDGGGIERYRQFNAGRQQAFLDAHEAAFEGAPAASALGTAEGPFSVRFLAGRTRPVAVENPRQVSAYRYPRDYGPRSPTFSRAALLDAGGGDVALLISGTASIVGHASVHAGDVEAQTRETIANLRAVIVAAHAKTSARFDLRDAHCAVYVRRPPHASAVRRAFESALGARSAAARRAIYLQADICRSELLVEIEAQAVARGKVD